MTSILRVAAILSLLSGVSRAQDRSEAFNRFAAGSLKFQLSFPATIEQLKGVSVN